MGSADDSDVERSSAATDIGFRIVDAIERMSQPHAG